MCASRYTCYIVTGKCLPIFWQSPKNPVASVFAVSFDTRIKIKFKMLHWVCFALQMYCDIFMVIPEWKTWRTKFKTIFIPSSLSSLNAHKGIHYNKAIKTKSRASNDTTIRVSHPPKSWRSQTGSWKPVFYIRGGFILSAGTSHHYNNVFDKPARFPAYLGKIGPLTSEEKYMIAILRLYRGLGLGRAYRFHS